MANRKAVSTTSLRGRIRIWIFYQRKVMAGEISDHSVMVNRMTVKNNKLYFRDGTFAYKIWRKNHMKKTYYVYR